MLAGSLSDEHALFQGLCNRLFQQDMIASPDGLHGRFEVHILRCANHDGIRIERMPEEIPIIGKTLAFIQAETFRHMLPSDFIQFHYANQLHLIGMLLDVLQVFIRPVTGPYRNDSYKISHNLQALSSRAKRRISMTSTHNVFEILHFTSFRSE